MNKCQFCKTETDLPWTYYGMTPIIESKELRIKEITEKYGDKKNWWEADKQVDAKELDDLIFYDQLLCTVGRAYVCKKCIKEDDKLYQKYKR